MRIEVRYRGEPGQTVDLVGEISHWREPHRLTECRPGEYATVLEVEPGVYACKFRLNGVQWLKPPDWPADDAEGVNNGTLVAGGTQPPVYFAPCRRCWVMDGERRLWLHFEIDAGTPIPALALLTAAGTVCGRIEPQRRLERGGRAFLQARAAVPIDAQCARFVDREEIFMLPAPEQHAPPEWLRQGTLYSIFVDRWHRAEASSPDPRATSRADPSERTVFYGGDLRGIRESLGYLRDLGVSAVALTPIHCSSSPHRYDATEFGAIDPALGGEPALDALIRDCHAHGLAIILDAVFTHCHASHPAFRDRVRFQEHSRYRDWFRPRRASNQEACADGYDCYADNPELPLLNLDCDQVREMLLAVTVGWFSRGIDAVRVDAMEQVPEGLWRELGRRARAVRPNAVLLGECLIEPTTRFCSQDGVDCVTDFRLRELMLRALGTQDIGLDDFLGLLEVASQRQGPLMTGRRLQFLDNHDTNRFITEAIFYARLRLALAFMLLRPEPVWFYYGTEHALSGRRCVSEFDNAWPDRLPMAPLETRTLTFGLTRTLLRLRRQLLVEGYGDPIALDLGSQLVAYERRGTNDQVRVLLNVSSRPAPLPVDLTQGEVLVLIELERMPDGWLPPQSGVVTRGQPPGG